MKIQLLVAAALLVLGLGASGAPAEPAKFEQPFGFLQKDSTCAEATHILKHPCPTGGGTIYLVFPKGKEADLAPFLDQNVAIKGTLRDSSCPGPLVQVSKITMSALLPPCVEP